MKKFVQIFLLGLTAMIISLSAHRASAESIGHYNVDVQRFKLRGKEYTSVVIVTRPETDIPSLSKIWSYEFWVEDLIKRAWNWSLDQYVEQGRMKRSDHIYKELKEKESMLDQSSGIVIICEGQDLDKMVAISRVTREGLGVDFFTSLERRRLQRLDRNQSSGIVEWKSFIRKRNSDRALIAVIFQQMVEFRFMKQAYLTETLEGKTRMVLPEHIVGETDRAMILHYVKKYGFEIIDYEPAPGEDSLPVNLIAQLKDPEIREHVVPTLNGLFIMQANIRTYESKILKDAYIRLAELGITRPTYHKLKITETFLRNNNCKAITAPSLHEVLMSVPKEP